MSTIVVAILLVVFLLFLFFIGFLGWFAFLSLRARDSRTHPPLRVIAVTKETVTLPRLKKTVIRGIFGLAWHSGDAVLGEVTDLSQQTVTRRILHATPSLSVGQLVRWNKFVYQGDPQSVHGLAYQEVQIPSRLGELPAWLIPGRRTTWVLVVHGFHATREEALRVLPPLSDKGFPTLVVTYRNDVGAPKSPDHLYHLGDTEWEDVEAGVRYALSRGAQDIVLFGWSMGGCLVETFLHRSSYAAHVRAVILDSPILNWQQVLEAQVQEMHFPRWCGALLKHMVTRLANIDFAVLNYERPTNACSIPTLLFHGTADAQVPVESSDLYVQARPAIVTYQRVEEADHTLVWNADPQAYEEVLTTFLQRISLPEMPL